MLSGPGQFHEKETNEIHFQEIPSHVLSKGIFLHSYNCIMQIIFIRINVLIKRLIFIKKS